MTNPCRAALAELVATHETALKFIVEEEGLSTEPTSPSVWVDFDRRFAAFKEKHEAAWAAARSALALEAVPPTVPGGTLFVMTDEKRYAASAPQPHKDQT